MSGAESTPHGAKVFVSYSSIDRQQADALRRLFQGLGHDVFEDHVSIRSGTRWRAALDRNLAEAEALVVLWTLNAKRSNEVRKEYEYFHANQAERGGHLVPICGDDTPLDDILSQYQSPNFAPVVNDVLRMKQEMEEAGHSPDAIEMKARVRIEKEGFDPDRAGISDDAEEKRKLTFLFLGFDWWSVLRRFPGAALKELGHKLLGTAWRNLVPLSAVVITAAAVTGAAWWTSGQFPIRWPPAERPMEFATVSPPPWVVVLVDSLTDYPDWGALMREIEAIHDRLDALDDPTPVDLAPLERLVVSGFTTTQGSIAEVRAVLDRMAELLEEMAFPETPVRDPWLDSIFSVVTRTETTMGEVYRSLVALANRPALRPSELYGRLEELRKELRAELARSQSVVDSIYRKVVEIADRPGLQLAAIERLLRTELDGPRDTLGRIHATLAGLEWPGGNGGYNGLTGPEVLLLLRRELAGPRDTLREILLRHEDGPVVDGAATVRRVLIFTGDYDVAPTFLDSGELQYPPRAKEQGIQGEVAVVATIDSEGRPRNVELHTSTPVPQILERWARTTVSEWGFHAATKNGARVPARVYVAFAFVLLP